MLIHVLLGKARDGLSPEELRELEAAVASLREVPGVEDFSWGVNFSERARGFTHGAVMGFADREALDGYQRDPLHVAVVEILNRVMPDRMIVDYEAAPTPPTE